MTNMWRRLRGKVRNAVLWGIGWGVLGFATTFTDEGVRLDNGEPEHRLTSGEGHIPVPQRAHMDAKAP